MAYPLTAVITVSSKADKLSVVMAMGIVIRLCMGTPSSISSGRRHEEGLPAEANYLV